MHVIVILSTTQSFLHHGLHTKNFRMHGQIPQISPRGVSKNSFPIIASVTSHWSTPEITLVLIRTMKYHQASIHQGAMTFDYHDITGSDCYMW